MFQNFIIKKATLNIPKSIDVCLVPTICMTTDMKDACPEYQIYLQFSGVMDKN